VIQEFMGYSWIILQWLNLILHSLLVWWISSYLLRGQVTRMLWLDYFDIWNVPLPEDSCMYADCGHECITDFLDADGAGSSINRRSTTGYCVFGGNVVSWKMKKQELLSRSSVESEYRARYYTWIGLDTISLDWATSFTFNSYEIIFW